MLKQFDGVQAQPQYIWQFKDGDDAMLVVQKLNAQQT